MVELFFPFPDLLFDEFDVSGGLEYWYGGIP